MISFQLIHQNIIGQLMSFDQIQMYKRKDNDIFGTSSQGYAPRIENNTVVDPNAFFKNKMEENYQKYAAKVTNTPSSITSKPLDSTKVNEKANFQDNYHKTRKETDMQSNIFYPPTKKATVTNDNCNSSVTQSRVQQQINFGRKQTLKRQIDQLPFNETNAKGNSSRLFDLDERIRPKTEQNIPIAPLIPYQMQWDQHDSVKYAHINDPTKSPKTLKIVPQNQVQNIEESKSTYFPQQDLKEKLNPITHQKEEVNVLKKVKSEKEIKKGEVSTKVKQIVEKGKEPVEIKILKGWDYKYMEGLSKYCKLNGAAILKFESEEEGKATLLLKRSNRWENVTDWMRKEAKLKIRVVNN